MASFAEDFRQEAIQRRSLPVQRRIRGWQFLLSYDDSGPAVTSCGEPVWHLSAMLIPKGRSSSEADWAYLGQMLQLFGCPKPDDPGVTLTPVESTSPNAAHHWTWTASGGPVSREWYDMMAKVLPVAREGIASGAAFGRGARG